MHISKIIIDGFKSYATRTVLSGFDQSFNAITGLNGSGKSNILDAICFVLGISNLSQVRVTNLEELVFKRGQAGVTKASVTITFDNSDQKLSPVGYEECAEITVARQVVIGGRNKYLINGKNAPLNRVQNLFLSVQLNVNNPHFLIMQGRITKVLNMKPPEILGMIEEAAGTRMYEMKKISAQKTILKKDKKLEEISRVLNEEIIPTLDKLKTERTKYIQWSQGKTEIDKLERYCVAYQYSSCLKQSEKARSDVDEMQKTIDELQKQADECQDAQKKLQKLMEKKKREKEDDIESEFTSLEKKVTELSKVLVKLNSQYQHKKEEFDAEKESYNQIKKQLEEERKSLATNKVKLSSFEEILQTFKERVEQCSNNVSNLNKQYEAVYAGIAVSEDSMSGRTLTEQLMDCKSRASSLTTEQGQLNIRNKHLQQTLLQKEAALKKMNMEDDTLKKQLHNLTAQTEQLESKLQAVNFNEGSYEGRVKQLEEMQTTLKKIDREIQESKGNLAHFFFNYDKSVIDPNSVKGLVANLFKIKNPKKSSIALEVTAGGKLYQIVVDNEHTAKNLIENGRLDRRVTVIPLSKIRYSTIPDQIINKAKKMHSDPALVLIEYDQSVDPAMKYAFGQTLVCDGLENAKNVAFDPQIHCRTVTYEGDSFDPRGTLTGGSRQVDAANSPLLKLGQIHELEKEREALVEKMHTLKSELHQQQATRQLYVTAKRELDLKKHECRILTSRMESSRFSQIQREIDSMSNELVANNAKLETVKQQIITNEAELKDVEDQLAQFTSTEQSREAKLKMIENNSRDAKKKWQKAKQEFQSKESEKDRLNALIEEQEEEISELEKKIKLVEESLEGDLKQEMSSAEKDALDKKSEYDTLKRKLEKKQSDMSKADEELGKLLKQKEQNEQRLNDVNLELKQTQHKMVRLQKAQKDAESIINNLLNAHSWISSEEHLFGKSNSDYDFSAQNASLEQTRQNLENMKSEHQKLSKTVNKKVMSMYEKAEQDYQDLMKKRAIVDKDKSKIEQVITELDEKKKQAIEKTWTKVNKDFGSIFSMLLPGTTSKLEPTQHSEEAGIEGLEVKVAFGQVWKQSLTELSGGQRSLLALSLILALLLFKPAPVYILDEIDAALDPSHTQNIGRMLKTHFTNSQFIVVSLKEGMFQNANVLFKTKFVNGQSQVARIVGHKSVMDEMTDEQPAEETAPQEYVSDEESTSTEPAILLSPTPVQKSKNREARPSRGRKRTRQD